MKEIKSAENKIAENKISYISEINKINLSLLKALQYWSFLHFRTTKATNQQFSIAYCVSKLNK